MVNKYLSYFKIINGIIYLGVPSSNRNPIAPEKSIRRGRAFGTRFFVPSRPKRRDETKRAQTKPLSLTQEKVGKLESLANKNFFKF